MKSKLADKHAELLAEQERIEDYIENIDDTEIRAIARMRFIDNKKFTEIANETYMDRTTAYRKLKRYVEGGCQDEG